MGWRGGGGGWCKVGKLKKVTMKKMCVIVCVCVCAFVCVQGF